MGAARSVGLPGGARRVRVGHAAPARSHGARRAGDAGGADARKHARALTSIPVIVVVAVACVGVSAAGRQPLGPKERDAVLAMLDAVDAAQRDGFDADARVLWDSHVLKSIAHKAYVPFVVSLDGLNGETFKSGAIYVRAVSHARNRPVAEQHSELRGWLRGAQPTMRMGETVALNAGELPVGG